MTDKLLNRTNILKLVIILGSVLFSICSITLFLISPTNKNWNYFAITLFISGVIIIISFLIKVYSDLIKNRIEIRDHFIQTEASIQITKLINPKLPFPTSGDWAATSHFLAVLFKYIIKNKPKTIIELGSGVSTLYSAQLIKDLNLSTQVISLDHEETYGTQTNEYLKVAQLDNHAQVIIAPLTTHMINNNNWKWYKTTSLKQDQKIDVLVVDGPITYLQSNARYPAIPLLFSRLSHKAIILVDDYNRKDEQAIVKLWLKEYDLTLIEETDSVKGYAVLQKN